MASEYRRQVVAGVGWSVLQRWVLRLSGLLTFVVLGRLLAPEQIGLVALGLAVVGLFTVLADVGVSAYVVRAEHLDERTSSTAFWMSLGLSVGGAGIVLLVAAPLSLALDQPQLRPVTQVLAANLVLFGLSSVPVAMMVRALAFRVLALREIASGLVGSVVGVSAAWAGAGVWSLVLQSTSQGAVALVLLWAVSPWRPCRSFSGRDAATMLRFGAPLLGTGLLQAVRDRLEQFLLGALGGVALLGYWTVATRLLSVLTEVTVSALDMVALPVFARARTDLSHFTRVFETASSMSTALLAPVLGALAVLSPMLLPAVFGPQWEPAVRPAQILSGAYALGALVYFNRTAYVAHGRPGTDLVLTMFALGTHLVAVLVAGPHGLVPLAWAMLVEAVVLLVLGVVLLRRLLGVPVSAFARPVVVLAAATVSTAAMFGTLRVLALPAVLEAAISVLVGALVDVGLLLLVARPLVRELWADLRRLVPKQQPRSL